MKQLLDALVAHWSSAGVKPNRGATEEQISALEKRAGVRLPADFRDYLLVVNGMPEDSVDLDVFHFWPTERVELADSDTVKRLRNGHKIPDPIVLLGFLDFEICAEVFYLGLSTASPSWCWTFAGGQGRLRFESFSSLVQSYLDEPDSLIRATAQFDD